MMYVIKSNGCWYQWCVKILLMVTMNVGQDYLVAINALKSYTFMDNTDFMLPNNAMAGDAHTYTSESASLGSLPPFEVSVSEQPDGTYMPCLPSHNTLSCNYTFRWKKCGGRVQHALRQFTQASEPMFETLALSVAAHLHDSALQMYKQPPFGGIDKLSILELLYEAALLFEEADVLPKVSSLDQDNPFLHGTNVENARLDRYTDILKDIVMLGIHSVTGDVKHMMYPGVATFTLAIFLKILDYPHKRAAMIQSSHYLCEHTFMSHLPEKQNAEVLEALATLERAPGSLGVFFCSESDKAPVILPPTLHSYVAVCDRARELYNWDRCLWNQVNVPPLLKDDDRLVLPYKMPNISTNTETVEEREYLTPKPVEAPALDPLDGFPVAAETIPQLSEQETNMLIDSVTTTGYLRRTSKMSSSLSHRIAVCMTGKVGALDRTSLNYITGFFQPNGGIANVDIFVNIVASEENDWKVPHFLGSYVAAMKTLTSEQVRHLLSPTLDSRTKIHQHYPPTMTEVLLNSAGVNVLGQHVHLSECLVMVEQHEMRTGQTYEWVVRARPDVFIEFGSLPPLSTGALVSSFVYTPDASCCLYSGMYDGFAIVPRRLADAYFRSMHHLTIAWQNYKYNDGNASFSFRGRNRSKYGDFWRKEQTVAQAGKKQVKWVWGHEGTALVFGNVTCNTTEEEQWEFLIQYEKHHAKIRVSSTNFNDRLFSIENVHRLGLEFGAGPGFPSSVVRRITGMTAVTLRSRDHPQHNHDTYKIIRGTRLCSGILPIPRFSKKNT